MSDLTDEQYAAKLNEFIDVYAKKTHALGKETTQAALDLHNEICEQKTPGCTQHFISRLLSVMMSQVKLLDEQEQDLKRRIN